MCFPVNKFCFCISLKAGTKIIAVLSMVCSLVTVVVYAGAGIILPASAQSKQCFYMLVAAIALCHVMACSLLIYGAFWSKPSYLWPWLLTSWILCCSLMVLSLLGVVLLSIQFYEDEETFTNFSTMSTFYFVYAVVVYYCVTVVQGRREEMIKAQETESADTLIAQQDTPKSLFV